MIYRLFIFLAIVFLSTASFAASSTQNSIHTYTLKNGLQLIVKEDHRAPVVMSQIWYKTGSAYESAGTTGAAHLLEHMMFQGTPKYPEGVLMNMVDQSGGEINAMTTTDYTMYYEKLANNQLALSFDVEADRMKALTLNQANFDKELQVVINERRMRTDNDPQSSTFERFNASAYLGNPYQHPVVGWMSDLNNMTLEDARNWYQTWYVPNNAIVVVVGDVNADEVYKLAQHYFGALKARPLPKIKPHTTEPALGAKTLEVKMPANLPAIFLGYNVPSHASAPKEWEPYALEVLAAVLDQDNSSRLNKDLVRNTEIATNAATDYSLYSAFPGVFLIYGVPAQGHTTEELKAAFLKEIKNLQDVLISEKELARVKTKLISKKTYKEDSLNAQATNLGELMVVGLPWQEVDDYYTHIQSITAQQLQEVTKKYFVEDNSTVAVLTPVPTSYKDE